MGSGESCVKPPSELDEARAELWTQVEALTAKAREKRAEELAQRGVAHLAEQRHQWKMWLDGKLKEKPFDKEPEAVKVRLGGRDVYVAQWHAQRYAGLIGKFKRIESCGHNDGFLVMQCGSCDEEHFLPIGCGHRECKKCRNLHANRTKRYIEDARKVLRIEARKRRCSKVLRERMLTLTPPHYDGDESAPAVERRIRVLFAAWDIFRDWLRDFQLERAPEGCEDLVHFFRVWEWTEGDDGQGHPHFHVYLHGPYLPHAQIVEAWARALRCASGEDIEDVIVDVRKATDAGNVRDKNGRKGRLVDELVKYMVKDYSLMTRDRFVDPVTLAHVLTEMMGRRQRQTSRGLSEFAERARMYRKRTRHCHCCGVVDDLEVFHKPQSFRRHEAPRGPPCEGRPGLTSTIRRPTIPAIPSQFRFQI